MSLSVTSHFASQFSSTNPQSLVSVFTFASSDMTSFVMQKGGRGSISRKATTVVGGSWKAKLQNATQVYNEFLTNKTLVIQDGTFEFGVKTESGTNDVVQLFGGKARSMRFDKKGAVSITFEDRLAQMKERTIGTKESPISFANTSMNVADMVWTIVTCYGGLLDVKSTSNTDINYPSWLEWWNVFNDEVVFMSGYFTGEKVLTVIEEVKDLTDSVIYAEGNNQLYFNRWSGLGSDTISIQQSDMLDFPVFEMKVNDMANKVAVLFGFNPTSETWNGTWTVQNSDSVNSYGLSEIVYDSEIVWYVDSVGANNFADRTAYRRSEPNISGTVEMPIGRFLTGQLGDEVLVTTAVNCFSDKPFTLNGYKIDVEKKKVSFSIDEGYSRGGGRLRGFILDDNYWGLLDQSYNPLI